ncbi:hypothetical protein HYV84_01690 [Candidatus Woesearchaeota archaeon]|nr:hypothetical protein [Candidatus Woesearchaeota archaeon]
MENLEKNPLKHYLPFSVVILSFVLSSCSAIPLTGKAVAAIPQDNGPSPKVFFCPKEDCISKLIIQINASTTIHCAFFGIDDKNLIDVLREKSANGEVQLVVDEQNKASLEGIPHRQDTSRQYMHDKFCILDGEKVVTGSLNPTASESSYNNNNLAIISSKHLAINYEQEFQELWSGHFGRGEKVPYPLVVVNGKQFENYFCPEDACGEKIIAQIAKAEKSILMASFSFTHEGIADALLRNAKAESKVLFEKRGSQGENSQFTRLRDFGFSVKTDTNPRTMHHKFIIIDNRTVVTGSMNPTANGDKKNDENIIIIHDSTIARSFAREFYSLWYR